MARILIGSTTSIEELLLKSEDFRSGYISLDGRKKKGKVDFEIYNKELETSFEGKIKNGDKIIFKEKTNDGYRDVIIIDIVYEKDDLNEGGYLNFKTTIEGKDFSHLLAEEAYYEGYLGEFYAVKYGITFSSEVRVIVGLGAGESSLRKDNSLDEISYSNVTSIVYSFKTLLINTDEIYAGNDLVCCKPEIIDIRDISRIDLITLKNDAVLSISLKNGSTYNISIPENEDVDLMDLAVLIQEVKIGISIANTPQEMAAITDLTKNEVIGIMPADSREKVLKLYGIETNNISQKIVVSKDEKYKITFIEKR